MQFLELSTLSSVEHCVSPEWSSQQTVTCVVISNSCFTVMTLLLNILHTLPCLHDMIWPGTIWNPLCITVFMPSIRHGKRRFSILQLNCLKEELAGT